MNFINKILIKFLNKKMATLRNFSLFDQLDYNNINLDILTETFSSYFYGRYCIKWQEYCKTLVSCTGVYHSYLLGKIEGNPNAKDWHGHNSAITVDPRSRR